MDTCRNALSTKHRLQAKFPANHLRDLLALAHELRGGLYSPRMTDALCDHARELASVLLKELHDD